MLIRNTNSGKKTIRVKPVLVTTFLRSAVEAAAVVVGAGRGGEHERASSASVNSAMRRRCASQDPTEAAPGSKTDCRQIARAAMPRCAYHQQPMALLIASDMHKDMAGKPLLRGVSFKLERRERMTIAGRNGAGKTTLLRMLAGETSIDRGELSVAKGVRIALHDQRPPREREMALRDYLLSGCAEELADRGGAGGARGSRWRARRERRGDARSLRARAGEPGVARRLPVAQPRDRDGARARLPRRGPRPPAGHGSPADS